MTQNPKNIDINQFDYPLPDDRIAAHPLQQRDRCKLLVRRGDGSISETIFTSLPDLLPRDSMLIYNNTRVINARLRFHKGENASGALIEVFCLEPHQPADYAVSFASTHSCSWTCIVGNSKRWKQEPLKMPLTIDGHQVTLRAEREENLGGTSLVKFTWDDPAVSFADIIKEAGEIPIPPYLNRGTEESDSTDYQTVYSHIDGSVAAPTAGLHFTDTLLEEISRRGIPRRELTLHVGAGTFKPVKSDTIGEHEMHSEFIAVSRDLIAELARSTRKVIAVGTTSVRTLESLYHIGCLISTGDFNGTLPQWYPYSESHPALSATEALTHLLNYLDSNNLPTLIAQTQIIIAPGYTYRIVKGMVTNFHQPRSTLLLLVSAFAGGDWLPIYEYALKHDFRFLSYGDACLLLNE
ncbi:MAG: S-adenosylmethionine:tRNA ribosyltransferase-isomerase [Muribaculaceae bacterium]|nr:S-adenosylmethionine:tRNA ribosyltransferase-isomerase [Muribaculaceae bacterium]